MKKTVFLFLALMLFVSACTAPGPAAPAATVQGEKGEAAKAEAQAQANSAETAAPVTSPADTAEAKPSEVPTAEAKPTEAPAAIQITDALGRELKFDKTPERIAIVGKGVFMVADAVYMFPSITDRIVAVAEMNQKSGDFLKIIDKEFDKKASIDKNAGPEQIAALKPDCVIMKTTNKELGNSLDQLGIPVVFVELETFSQYQADLGMLGELFQEQDRAIRLQSYYSTYVADVSKYFKDTDPKDLPTVLFINYSDSDGTTSFSVPPMDWLQTAMIETAGGVPIWKDANPAKGWTKVNFEQIAAWDPDVIFVTSYKKPVPEVVDLLEKDPQWKELRATKNNNLKGMLGDIYTYDQPDTRWVLGLLWIARELHPEIMWPIDFYESARNFYDNMYGMDTKTYEAEIKPLLKSFFGK